MKNYCVGLPKSDLLTRQKVFTLEEAEAYTEKMTKLGSVPIFKKDGEKYILISYIYQRMSI